MKNPVNDSRRIQNFDFGPARACLARTKECAAVRAEWKRLFAGNQPVEVAGGAAVAEALNRVYELANETTLALARILEARELTRATVRAREHTARDSASFSTAGPWTTRFSVSNPQWRVITAISG